MYDYKKAARQKRKRKNARRAKELRHALQCYHWGTRVELDKLMNIHPSFHPLIIQPRELM